MHRSTHGDPPSTAGSRRSRTARAPRAWPHVVAGAVAAVVLVDDVNSPAATYPTPDERAYAAVPYAVEHAAALARAGARAAAVRYHGTVHDVATLDPLADTPAARGAIAPSLAAVQGALRA